MVCQASRKHYILYSAEIFPKKTTTIGGDKTRKK